MQVHSYQHFLNVCVTRTKIVNKLVNKLMGHEGKNVKRHYLGAGQVL